MAGRLKICNNSKCRCGVGVHLKSFLILKPRQAAWMKSADSVSRLPLAPCRQVHTSRSMQDCDDAWCDLKPAHALQKQLHEGKQASDCADSSMVWAVKPGNGLAAETHESNAQSQQCPASYIRTGPCTSTARYRGVHKNSTNRPGARPLCTMWCRYEKVSRVHHTSSCASCPALRKTRVLPICQPCNLTTCRHTQLLWNDSAQGRFCERHS